jgi:hypothetical protein
MIRQESRRYPQPDRGRCYRAKPLHGIGVSQNAMFECELCAIPVNHE